MRKRKNGDWEGLWTAGVEPRAVAWCAAAIAALLLLWAALRLLL